MPPSDAPRLSCVLPAFDEEETIEEVVTALRRALDRLAPDSEILVVDDGSRDRTGALLDAMAARPDGPRALHLPENRGYGAALRVGFAAATHPLVFFTDSDGQFDPMELGGLIAHARDAELVVGRRVGRRDGLLRGVWSRGYNVLAQQLVGLDVQDVNCAFKLIRRDALMRLRLHANGYTINAELLARAAQAGMRVREVPVKHRPRRGGRSKVGLRDAAPSFLALLALRQSLTDGGREGPLNTPRDGDTRGRSSAVATVPSARQTERQK